MDAGWKGVSTLGATAVLEAGKLTLTCPERAVVIQLDTPTQVAWAQALFAKLMPALAGAAS